MDHLDVKQILEKAVKSADSIIIIANDMKKGTIKAVESNAYTNAYRSAGNLYLGILHAIEGSTLTIEGKIEPTELSIEDRDRLDKLSKILVKKPNKKRAKKESL